MIDERMNRETIIDRLPKWILSSNPDRSGKFEVSFRSVSQVFLQILCQCATLFLVFQEMDSPGLP